MATAATPMTQFGMTHLCFRVDDIDDLVDLAEKAGGTVHRHTLSELPGAGWEVSP